MAQLTWNTALEMYLFTNLDRCDYVVLLFVSHFNMTFDIDQFSSFLFRYTAVYRLFLKIVRKSSVG